MGSLQARVVERTTELFSHAPDPLSSTQSYRGDPGLFGPGSTTWELLGDPAAFVGGIRALLVQAAHPEVLAGVVDHSRFREDPLGRLSRTSAYVTATTYGAMAEVEAAIAAVRRAHRGVVGRSSRGRPYAADDPGHAAWVHQVLVESFLVAFETYGPRALEAGEADRFVAEQVELGRLLGAAPLVDTAAALHRWIEEHPDLGRGDGIAETVGFVLHPPLSRGVRVAYRLLAEAAVVTIPERIRRILGLVARPGARPAGRLAVAGLRWALGASPAWYRALRRVGAPIPEGRFRPARIAGLGE
ncbi:MAG TPA: DUF2236 domain-containing protein [Actinobacteria bacterium]|nr:DUF2236 domain-containing protein [Actinomycetota bacterium]